ncbi:MAG: hypothetical protein V1778_04335 [bacterium]
MPRQKRWPCDDPRERCRFLVEVLSIRRRGVEVRGYTTIPKTAFSAAQAKLFVRMDLVAEFGTDIYITWGDIKAANSVPQPPKTSPGILQGELFPSAR